MGWTSYHAKFYKNGTVDRKKECDEYWEGGLNRGNFKVVKSTMVGSTYYAAITSLKEVADKGMVDIPINEQKTFGVVFLTSVDMKDYYNFSYKDMDETCGPNKHDCPKGILNLLSPTNNEYALHWRNQCWKNIEEKNNPNSLNKLPEQSIIEVILPFDTQRYKKGEKITLIKVKYGKSYKWFIQNSFIYFNQQLMKALNNNYRIIKRGDE